MHPFQALQLSIQEEFHLHHSLPSFLNQSVELLKRVHIYYRSYQHLKTNGSSSKLPYKKHAAIYGAALHLLGDYTAIGQYALNLALMTKCADDLLHEYKQLDNDYQRLSQSLKWQYPLYQVHREEEGQIPLFKRISPSHHSFWNIQCMGLMRQIKKIIHCVFTVFVQIFKLSMSLCDAYLLCNHDTKTRYEACTELVEKWDEYQKKLKSGQIELAEEIKKGALLADRILKHLGVQHNSASIFHDLTGAVTHISKNQDILKKVHQGAHRTLDSVYVKGKITPLTINLSGLQHTPSTLPYRRFPPWCGQKVIVKNGSQSSSFSTTADQNLMIDPFKAIILTAQFLQKNISKLF